MTETDQDAVARDAPAVPMRLGGDTPAPRSFLAAAPRLLRGRYRWAFALGAVLGTLGATAGAKLPRPVYKSVGLIDVKPKVARVLYSDMDEKGLLPMFDAYVASEAAVAGTRRVVDMAMASPQWKKFGRGTTDDDVANFQAQLSVTHPRYTEHVEVAFSDGDPEAAMVATNQVIDAYMKVVKERETVSGLSTVATLENTVTVDNSKLAELRANVLAVTEGLGEQAIEARYAFAISELNKFDSVLHEVDLQIASARSAGESRATQRPLTEQEIALRDPGMDQLLLLRDRETRRVEFLAAQLGSKHQDLITAKADLESIVRRMEERAEAFRLSPPGTTGREATLPEQEAHRERVAALRDATLEETKRLGKQKLLVENISADQNLLTEQLEQVKKRQEQINIESEVHGRISVIAHGDRPVVADTDRRIPLAVLGGLGGVLLGFGIVILWGVSEAKLRHVTDVTNEASRGTFLGVLPDLGGKAGLSSTASFGASGTMRADLADYCVHHIRTMLQLRKTKKRLVIAVTSPSPRAGKTTLGIGLGMSFAATKLNTLVVDCDFLGHGTTSAMRSFVGAMASRALFCGPDDDVDASARPDGAHPLMAALLAQRSAVPNVHQFEDLISPLRERAAKGDEQASKSLRSIENLQHPRVNGAVDASPHGVLGVLRGRPLGECVVDVGVPHLAVLPVGDAHPHDAMNLSPAVVERLIAACREHYDMVLIDTGPVLGSIEAAFVAAAADEVVLVIPRNERRALVDEAIQRLEGVGADVAGVVFNRASEVDIASSNYSCSQSKAGG